MEPALCQLFENMPAPISIIKHSGASFMPAFSTHKSPFYSSKSTIDWISKRKWSKPPRTGGQCLIEFLPPGPVQRHSMAKPSQWSILKQGTNIFHTMTLNGARGSTKYDAEYVEHAKSRNSPIFNMILIIVCFFIKIDVVVNRTTSCAAMSFLSWSYDENVHIRCWKWVLL